MLRQAPPSGPVHLALSGGGIRAALFSAGALIAVAEAEHDMSKRSALARYQGAGELNVASTTAVSGSSLLLGRLILQGAKADHAGSRLHHLRTETELLWRHGFRRRWPGAFLLSALISAAIVAWALDVFSPFQIRPEVLWVVPAALVALLTWRRLVGFTLDIRRGWIAWPLARLRALWRQHRWHGNRHRQDDVSLLSDGPIRMVTTNLSSQEAALWDPWAPPSKRFGRASMHDLTKASAALPIYRSSVRLDGDPHFDGGVLDNLGVSYGLHQPDGWVLSIDAGLPGDVVVPRSTKLFDKVRLATLGLGREWTALAATQSQQRDYLYTYLTANGRPYVKVRLTDGRHFSQPSGRERHDLATKLSPLARHSGREVIREGYRGTCRALGRIETDETIAWINSLQKASLQDVPRRLGLPRLGRLLKRIFISRL